MSDDRQSIFIKAVAIAIIFVALGAYLYMSRDMLFSAGSAAYGFVAKNRPITYDYNSQAGFYSTERGHYYFFTRNSISYRSEAGDIVWSRTHDLSNPIAYGAGDYLMLSELRGSSVSVYSPDENRMYSKIFDKPILHFSVNESGISCVRVQDGSGYRMWVFDHDGAEVYGRYHGTENVYPLTFAVSPNGRELALSLLDLASGSLRSHLLLSYVQRTRSIENVDGEWGGYEKAGQIITSLWFNGNNDLYAASESAITRYWISGSGQTNEVKSVEYTNTVAAFEYMGDAGVVLALGQGLPGFDSVTENTVQFYNMSLELVESFSVPRSITYLCGDRHGAIVGTGQTYYGFNTKGVLQWQHNANMELKQLIYLSDTNTVIEVGFTEARVLKRERVYNQAADEYAEPPERDRPDDFPWDSLPQDGSIPTQTPQPSKSGELPEYSEPYDTDNTSQPEGVNEN